MDLAASSTAAQGEQPVRRVSPAEKAASPAPDQSHVTAKAESTSDRPPLSGYVSSPAFNSPMRQHRRNPSSARQVKESLNARSEYITSQDDGTAEHRINQYIIKQEIGRGSFGAVHLALDQYGKEYAVKEFSKSRLRKRAQSHLLRKPLNLRRPAQRGKDFNSPLHRAASSGEDERSKPSSIELIKEEIAVMKKLNHPNIVSLIEVLDDPSEDSLYMVMEMCKKGLVMKVGLDETADPYPDETCRCWFRDLILGIEYLHAQGIVHRDIKPDNCLVTEDDVLKVVDFGVSEMFEKDSAMMTAKSAGSPAFLPPELCVAKHGDISAKAADIWSMGVTLYCMKYGRVPFEKTTIFEMYDAIRSDTPNFDEKGDQDFQDLMNRILEKNPANRISMHDLRQHPWVTKRGQDPLLSEEENTSDLVEPPTESEMNAAITGNMRNLMAVVKAVKKFKMLTAHKRPMDSILGDHANASFSQPPGAYQRTRPSPPGLSHKPQSLDTYDRQTNEGAMAIEGVHKANDRIPPGRLEKSQKEGNDDEKLASPGSDAKAFSTPSPLTAESSTDSVETMSKSDTQNGSKLYPPFRSTRAHTFTPDETGRKGQAHNPLEDHLYLYIGPSTFSGPSLHSDGRPSMVPEEDEDVFMVSESPGAADVDIYETAYRDEIERILARTENVDDDQKPTVFLTRRVDEKLMALSGHAGRWMAVGEEGLDQLRDYTRFRERRAKVTDVSKALRDAARAEYAKRKQERKDQLAALRAEKGKTKDSGAPAPSHDTTSATAEGADPDAPPNPGLPLSKFRTTSSKWGSKALDKRSQAKTSFKGLVGMVKTKAAEKDADPGSG